MILATLNSEGIVNMGDQQIDVEMVIKKAVKDTFYVIGVDVDDPKDVEEFRKDLRFSGSLRSLANKGATVFWLGIVAALGAALWVGIVSKIKGTP